MHDTLIRLIQPRADWHIISLTAATLERTVERETADLLICDHLSAHCPDMQAVLAEWIVALKPGGWLAVMDTLVPGSRLRGKKANLQRRAGVYVNALLRGVDGENGRNLSQDEWLDILRVVNISHVQYETHKREIEFSHWAEAAAIAPPDRTRLRAMLRQTPEPVTAFLTPQAANDRITFFLTELVLVGRLGAGPE